MLLIKALLEGSCHQRGQGRMRGSQWKAAKQHYRTHLKVVQHAVGFKGGESSSHREDQA